MIKHERDHTAPARLEEGPPLLSDPSIGARDFVIQMAARLKRSSSRATTNPADVSVAALTGPLEAARRRARTNALLLVDLDNFHVLNNGLGRLLGDTVLGVVATRLEQSVSGFGQCLLCGGDRFIVLVSETTKEPNLASIAARLIEAVRAPIPVEDGAAPLVVSASVGSVIDDGAAVDELVRRADIALSRAKKKEPSGHVSFEPEMQQAVEAEARLERELREALDSELLFLAYLPGVDIDSGRVTSAEALLRWNHPRRGVIAAREFVPILEKSGTILEVGSWVLQEACMQAAAWQRRGMSLELHVNLSARQLGADTTLDDLRDSLFMSRLDPALLVLEVAEATFATETWAVAARLEEFKALGVSIAMDSFGASYAALSHLKHLPIDIVEFDRSLVAEIGRNDSAAALVRTLVKVAESLGLKTLAAGVEDEEQLKQLRNAGCSGALGHLYSEPVDADELDKVFREFELDTTGWSPGPVAEPDPEEVVDETEAVEDP
ncbi:MAG: bifunctional diguanylate cyclase/phosphodiesterase [Acidimicrobiales bacterium]|jgi:diguanylate cyclase (GGDEF)-like protein